MKNKLLSSFLEVEENEKMFLEYLKVRDEETKKTIEERFKFHVVKIKILKYFANVMHFEAQRFDKKIRNIANKNLLIFDSDVSDVLVEQLEERNSTHDTIDFSNNYLGIQDMLENEELFNIINSLKPKDNELLYMIYSAGLDEDEIATTLGVTKQAINKRKNKILTKIKNQYNDDLKGFR